MPRLSVAFSNRIQELASHATVGGGGGTPGSAAAAATRPITSAKRMLVFLRSTFIQHLAIAKYFRFTACV